MTATQIQLDFRRSCPSCEPEACVSADGQAASPLLEPTIVRPAGDFASDRAGELDAMLRAASECGQREVIADLAGVGLLGAASLGTLVRHRRHLRLRRVPTRVGVQLRLTGLDRVLRQ